VDRFVCFRLLHSSPARYNARGKSARTCPGLCRKVGVMEFGLYSLMGHVMATLLYLAHQLY